MAYMNSDGQTITGHASTTRAHTTSVQTSVPLMDYISTTDPAKLWEDQASIRTVVGAIAKDISSIPLHAYKQVGEADRQRVRTTAVAELLRQPIPRVTQSRWIEQLILDMAVFDRWAALIGADPATGKPALWHLPAHTVTILCSSLGVPEKVAFFDADSDVWKTIDVTQVVFDIAPQAIPQQYDRGNPRLKTLSALTDELDLAAQWRSKVLANGAWVPAVIERPKDAPKWDDDSYNRFRETFKEYRAGGGQAGGTPILEDGMQLKKADVFSPKDFDTAEMRNVTLLEACLLFNYPPELLGARPGTYSNIESFREQKYVDVLGSWITNLEQALNVGLSGILTKGEYIEAHLDAKLRGAFDDQAKILSSSTGRPWLTTNEARARMNMPRIDGGDELVTPLNVTTGGLASPRDTAPTE